MEELIGVFDPWCLFAEKFEDGRVTDNSIGEKLKESLELAYLYQWAQANLSVTLFHNDVEDFIHETPTPDGEDEYFSK